MDKRRKKKISFLLVHSVFFLITALIAAGVTYGLLSLWNAVFRKEK